MEEGMLKQYGVLKFQDIPIHVLIHQSEHELNLTWQVQTP